MGARKSQDISSVHKFEIVLDENTILFKLVDVYEDNEDLAKNLQMFETTTNHLIDG
jgi:hypothetical protein